MKTTLNPFENAKRTAQGAGGVSPSVIEEIQAEITVLGSQNETQAQDITDIKAQLEELASAYSTTEHKTGRKSIDGKDIYEKTIYFLALPNTSTVAEAHGINYDKIISISGSAYNDTYSMPIPYVDIVPTASIKVIMDHTNLTIQTGSDRHDYSANVTITYTKPTT